MILLGFEKDEVSEQDLAAIQSIKPGVRVQVTKDREQIARESDEIRIAAGNLPTDLIELLLRGKNFRWYQQWGAGVNWLMQSPQAIRKDFILTNASGVHAIPISEHIFALVLAFARGLPHAIRSQMHKQWSGLEGRDIFELAGKTMLLVGTGAIGARTAGLATALGMRVWGIRRNPEQPLEGVEAMYSPGQILDLLPEVDFVVLTVPLTPETQGMIGRAELKAMRSSAYIVNIGRGNTIEQDALVQALQEGWIAGAGLDVFESEPLPEESPLWDMPNVIVTAHYAGSTPHYHERAMGIFLDNLRRYVAGEPLRNVVDKELGY